LNWLLKEDFKLKKQDIIDLKLFFEEDSIFLITVWDFKNVEEIENILKKIKERKALLIGKKEFERGARLRDFEERIKDIKQIYIHTKKEVSQHICYHKFGLELFAIALPDKNILDRFRELGLEVKEKSLLLKQLDLI
jgi:hypothetical protein